TGHLADALASCEAAATQFKGMPKGLERDQVADEVAGCFTVVHGARAEIPAAVKWAERWLDVVKFRFGADSFGTLGALRELVTLRFSEGRADVAIALARKALAIAEKALGTDSEELLDDLSALAQMLHSAGQMEDAIAVAQRAVPIVERTTASTSLRKRFVGRMTLGQLFKMLDRPEDMARHYQGALELGEQLPADDDHVATARFIIGVSVAEGGDRALGRELVERAAATWARTHNPRAHVAQAMRGELLELDGRCAEALPILERAVAGMEAAPSERANLIRGRMHLASCLPAADAARATQLVEGVVVDARGLGSTGTDLAAEAVAWLAARRSSAVVRTGDTQWANRVIGVSSQYGSVSWAAVQALGAPDTYPTEGDARTAWAPLSEDDGDEWIEVAFGEPAPARAIAIYETFNAGAIKLVELVTAGGRRAVYRAEPAREPGAKLRTIAFPCTGEPVAGVRITLASRAVPGWNEIDAIGAVACR
ncbi:MAG: tetratricopeptide repeat protein, partial [Deltaproteobacteria bacterium]|nr:tetratricopeptide repeat protein [Deltaproteobacteria bacterium]